MVGINYTAVRGLSPWLPSITTVGSRMYHMAGYSGYMYFATEVRLVISTTGESSSYRNGVSKLGL